MAKAKKKFENAAKSKKNICKKDFWVYFIGFSDLPFLNNTKNAIIDP